MELCGAASAPQRNLHVRTGASAELNNAPPGPQRLPSGSVWPTQQPEQGSAAGDGSTHRRPAPPPTAPAAPGPAQGPAGTQDLSGHPLGFQRKHVFTCQPAHVPFFLLRRQEELGVTSARGLGRCRSRLLAETEESEGTGSPGMPPSVPITAERQGASEGAGRAHRPPPSATHLLIPHIPTR